MGAGASLLGAQGSGKQPWDADHVSGLRGFLSLVFQGKAGGRPELKVGEDMEGTLELQTLPRVLLSCGATCPDRQW